MTDTEYKKTLEYGKRVKNVIEATMIRNGWNPKDDTWIIIVGKCTRDSCGAMNILLSTNVKNRINMDRCAGCGYPVNISEILKREHIRVNIKNNPIYA